MIQAETKTGLCGQNYVMYLNTQSKPVVEDDFMFETLLVDHYALSLLVT